MSLNKIFHTHLTAGAQKNMLKVWNFTKNKLYHVWFENNLRKISEQIFLRMLPDRYALNSCFNCPLMLRHLTDLICTWRESIKKMRSILTVRKISLFEFYDMCYIHLQSYRRRNTIWFWLISVWQWQFIWKWKWKAFSHSNCFGNWNIISYRWTSQIWSAS